MKVKWPKYKEVLPITTDYRFGHKTLDFINGYNLAINECKQAYAESVPTLSDDEIISLALTSGFMLSTQYGQEKEKIMPVSDKNTLVTFYKAIRAMLTSKGEEI